MESFILFYLKFLIFLIVHNLRILGPTVEDVAVEAIFARCQNHSSCRFEVGPLQLYICHVSLSPIWQRTAYD